MRCQTYLHLGKRKLFTLLKALCVVWGLACPSESTNGQLIADQPDKRRHSPGRCATKGKSKLKRGMHKVHKPKTV
jgi:hypothetical protein